MKRLLILLLTLALPAISTAAQADTPDECAARLDLDIRVTTYAEAITWIEQVLRECAPQEGAGEGITRLELSTSLSLTNAKCTVYYFEGNTADTVYMIPRLFTGSIKLHWRHGIAGDWTELQQDEIIVLKGGGVNDQVTPYRLPGKAVMPAGAGIHQFELRTRHGVDKFEIMETWGAAYLIDIDC